MQLYFLFNLINYVLYCLKNTFISDIDKVLQSAILLSYNYIGIIYACIIVNGLYNYTSFIENKIMITNFFYCTVVQ